MLRFKVDENLPKEVAELLATHGHDALWNRTACASGGIGTEAATCDSWTLGDAA